MPQRSVKGSVGAILTLMVSAEVKSVGSPKGAFLSLSRVAYGLLYWCSVSKGPADDVEGLSVGRYSNDQCVGCIGPLGSVPVKAGDVITAR